MEAPPYKVTRKKYVFKWGNEQQHTFEMAKQPVQQALDLWPLQPGRVELNVSVNDMYANWGLWQKQGKKKVH